MIRTMKMNLLWKPALVALGLLLPVVNSPAQTVTNPNPNRVISWNLDDTSTIYPADLAGLAPATNWVDTWLNNITTSVPDNTGTATTLNLSYSSFNSYHVGGHPGYDANGTANRELLNGFLNSGPAAWGPWTTNTSVTLTNIPYAKYDVIIYFNSDTSGRHASIDNGTTAYYFSTVGSPSRSGANALFLPTTTTNSASFPTADFAFFPGMTTNAAMFTEKPKSGNDQWLGIAAFQVIECSNTYVVYGPSPATQIVPVGQPASFSVMAGGLNPAYQWRHAGTNLLNATNATYNLVSAQAGQDGNYDVIVSNSFSSVTSVVATLTFYSPKAVEWDGVGSTWDTSSLFWTMNGGASTTNYTETDNVRFGPLGSAQPYVSLAATVTPSSITVSNGSYTFAGGSLDGSGSLRLKNNATLILDTVDTRTGPTLIDAGSTLQLDNGDTAASLGSGALTNNGALLFNAGGDEAYGYPVYGTGSITNLGSGGTITLGNNVNATYLVQAGSGVLLLQGSNSLSGGFTVSSGTVWARAANCLGMSPITVSGGELQLIFNIDFAGTNMTLAGGLLHGGISGANIFEGQVSLATDSSIQVDGGGLTLANPAGLNGDTFNLTKTGNGTLILNGNSNSWNSLTLGGGTVAFNSAANLSVTSSVSGIGNLSQTGGGTTTLSGDHSGMLGNLTVSGGKLLVNTASSAALADVTGGALGGNGTIAGPVSIEAGGTLAPGTASIGTLTLSSDLTLGGNVSVKVNRSLAQSNDLVSVSGTLSCTNAGTLTVNNLGPALAAGDQFILFSQPVTGGENLAVSGGGVTWSNSLANDGSIVVLSTLASYSTNISYSVSGSTLTITWPATHLGWVLQQQTNSLSAGLGTNWTDMAGSSAVTSTNITINPALPTAFYRLHHP
jgi:autotransporter-associated beta strand protein